MHSQAEVDGSTYREHLINRLEDSLFNDEEGIEKYLFENFKLYNVKPKSVEASFVKNDIFNRFYNLYSKDDKHELLGPVLNIPDKRITRPKRLVTLVKAYAENRIYNIFGLDITKFMKLNALEIELLLESAQQINEDKERALSELKDGHLSDDIISEFNKELD